MIPDIPQADKPVWLLVASGGSSIANLALTGFGIRSLTVAAFGTLSLLIAASLLCAGVVRASVGEAGYDSATRDGVLSVRRLWVAFVVSLPLTAAVFLVQLSVVAEELSFVGPGAAFATAAAIAEVSKVRLVSSRRYGLMALMELARLVLLGTLLVLLAPATVSGILFVGAISLAPTVASAIFGPQGHHTRLAPKEALTAGFDVLVQRSGGQVAASVVFAASATALGAIATARFAMAPITTLYTSAAGLALAGSSANTERVRRLLFGCLFVGISYVGALLIGIRVAPGRLERLLGSEIAMLGTLLVPIGVFAVSGALAPVLSTSLRRIGQTTASLRARFGASASLILVVVIVVAAAGSDLSPVMVGWAYAFAGLLGSVFWVRSYHHLQKVVA